MRRFTGVQAPGAVRSIGLLFDGNALCQVAGLVDVSAFEHGGMVGEELDWDRIEQRGDERVAVGHGDVEGEAVGKPSDPSRCPRSLQRGRRAP